MQIIRPLSSTIALALTGALAACAGMPGQHLPGGTVGPALTQPQPAPPPSAQAVVPVEAFGAQSQADANDEKTREPILIRGDDRTFRAKPSPGAVKGPVSSFKFENAPSGEVVHVMLRDLLKVDYVVHPPLNGNITLTTRGEASADKALLLLETALQVNGIVMAQDSRGTYHVGTPEALKGIISAPRMADSRGMAPGYGAIIIAPQYLGAAEMANILRPMVPAEAIVRVDSLRNILVMRGTRAEAEGWMDIVRTFDVNLLRGMSVGVFPLKHSSVEEVQAALQLLAGGAAAGATAGASGAPAGTAAAARAPAQVRPGTQQQTQAAAVNPAGIADSNPLFGAVRILPIERINAIMVVTPRSAYLDEIRYWIEQFDRPNLNSAEPQLFVYKVRNGSADHLAELLNGIYGGTNAFGPSTGATGVAPGLGGTAAGVAGARSGIGSTNNLSRYSGNQNSARSTLAGSRSSGFGGSNSRIGGLGGGLGTQVNQGGQGAGGGNTSTVALSDTVRVMADYINNTLLIHAKPAEYARIETTLKRLDVPRAQVLIDASIVEVSSSDGMSFGAKWNFSGAGIGRYSGSGGVGNSAVSIGDLPTGQLGAAGFTYMLRNSSNPVALLQASSNSGNLRYLSNPSLMVMDNHTATISVGDQIPVQSSNYYGGTNTGYLTTNYEFKDTGVILNITPQVNAGNLVTMEIDQEVTDVGEDRPVGETKAPTFRQRTMSSKVAVRSGETLVLGGLVKQNERQGKEGLPFLSSIPLLGALFGEHSKEGSRTELLLVITPRVIRSDAEAREVSRELRDRMRSISETGWPAMGGSPKAPAFPRPHISTPEEGQDQ